MDIGGSAVARKVSGLILSNFRSMICDLGFVLQAGHQEGELPERLIGTVRTRECDLTKAEGFVKAPWATKTKTPEAPAAAAAAHAPAATKKSFYFF